MDNMTRAEERALEAYPYKIEEHPKVMGGVITYDANKQPRVFFQEGYEQAEKDLGWISVKDRLPEVEQLAKLREMTHEIRDAYERGIEVGRVESKQEWSEEDEKMLRTIISDGSRGVELDSKQISWLKSLRPQSKKELSIEKAIQWLDDTFYFLDNSSGRGRDCEITTHDFDSLEEMYDSFRKAVTVDSEPSWKPSGRG